MEVLIKRTSSHLETLSFFAVIDLQAYEKALSTRRLARVQGVGDPEPGKRGESKR
jgi:hypothetical protein